MRTGRSWDAVARELRGGFHVVAMDARGHGDSEWPSAGYRYEARLQEVAGLCREAGLKDVIGVGHSSGASVIALAAQRHPGLFSRLALLEPVVEMNEEFQRRVAQREHWSRSTWASREELRRHLERHAVAGRWRDDVIADVVAHEAMELPDGRIDMKWSHRTMAWAEREGDYFDLKPFFRSFGKPILLVVSSERRAQYEAIQPIAGQVRGLDFVTIARTGHNMYMERPDAVARAIRDFAQGKPPPATV
jgi:pimeloyl-ACP methyl ester carboxylesterase